MAATISHAAFSSACSIRRWRTLRNQATTRSARSRRKYTTTATSVPRWSATSKVWLNAGICRLLRNRSKFPHLRACARIESARGAGISVCTGDEKVLINHRGRTYGTTMSISPSLPKPDTASPVYAFSAIKRCPTVKKILGGRDPSPGQKATPRRVGSAFGSKLHNSFPVSGSSATIRLFVGRYIMPLTTIGVTSVPPVIPSARTFPTL